MAVLTPKQKQYLKGLAHPLSPIVRLGRAGLRETVVNETKKSLAAHELIKVRIDTDDSSSRKDLAQRLAEATDSQIAGSIGKIVILYREREEDPEIELP